MVRFWKNFRKGLKNWFKILKIYSNQFSRIVGDFSKTTYFIIRKSPIQFVICGCLQILINMAIIGQAIYYSPKSKTTTTTVDVSAYNLMRY